MTTMLCGLSLGCHRSKPEPQQEQIRAALNTFYAGEPACLWLKPITLERSRASPEGISATQARALENAGLIYAQRHNYKLTSAAAAFWRSDPTEHGFGNVCFGKWHADRIVSMVARPDPLFGDTTEVQFDATVASPALWTRLPAMRDAFPLMAAEVSRPLPHSATMKHTDKGWQVAVIEVPSVL